jgi:hypothetical protein
MPPQVYQAPTARDVIETTTGSELNGKNIALIIFVAVIPVLIVAGAVSWLLCCYGRGWGCGRSKKDNKSQTHPTPGTPPQMQDSAGQTAGWLPAAQNPELAHARNDSMMSEKSNASSKNSNLKRVPTLPQGFV